MRKLYTSDLHFGHVRILLPEYCNRVAIWPDVPTMNEGLIARYNAVVKDDDEVYIIGDFAMGNKDAIPGLVSRLKGKKYLIVGNHDYVKPGKIRPQLLEAGFAEICERARIVDGGKILNLHHEPEPVPDGCDYTLCGHVHSSFTRANFTTPDRWEPDPEGDVINVGVDVSDYEPKTLDQMLCRPYFVGERHRG